MFTHHNLLLILSCLH